MKRKLKSATQRKLYSSTSAWFITFPITVWGNYKKMSCSFLKSWFYRTFNKSFTARTKKRVHTADTNENIRTRMSAIDIVQSTENMLLVYVWPRPIPFLQSGSLITLVIQRGSYLDKKIDRETHQIHVLKIANYFACSP